MRSNGDSSKRFHGDRLIPVLLLSALLATVGCGVQQRNLVPAASQGIGGAVHGGQQPVSGATISLYAASTASDGAAASSLLSSAVFSQSDGSFSITGSYSCPSADANVYLVASGGNPGLGGSLSNPALSLMAALGRCGALGPQTFISINEVTTVGAIAALAPFMTSGAGVGASSAHTQLLANAFMLASEYVNVASGSAPGSSVPAGTTVPSSTINTLADILAACVNSAGGTAGDGTPCGTLFALTTQPGSPAPTNTISAMLSLLSAPMLDPDGLFSLVTANGPFQPVLSQTPSDFSVRLSSAASLTFTPSSLSFPSTLLGQSADPQTVVVSNPGPSTVLSISSSLLGTGTADYTVSNDCPVSGLAAGGHCTFTVEYTPVAAGARNASLAVTGSGNSLTIPLIASAVSDSGALASSLASELVNTGSLEQTYRAQIDCLQAIGIGLYTADGTPILAGAERGLGDFYLYNFELGALSMMVRDPGQVDATQLVAGLSFNSSSKYSDPATFYSGLVSAAAQAVKAPTDRSNFILLLIRELGLRAPVPYDLAAGPDMASVMFSPLQQWLFRMEFALPFLASQTPVQSSLYNAPESPTPSAMGTRMPQGRPMTRRKGASPGRPKVQRPMDTPAVGVEWVAGGLSTALGLDPAKYPITFQVNGDVEALTAVTAAIIKAEHGYILSQLLEVKPSGENPLLIKYGDKDHKVAFSVDVSVAAWNAFQQELAWERLGAAPFNGVPASSLFPDSSVVVAGPMIGLTLPKGPGKVKDIKVTIGYGGLLAHLTKTDCPDVCMPTTDDEGSVDATLSPKPDETMPFQVTIEKSTYGLMLAVVDANKAFGSSGTVVDGAPVNNVVPIFTRVPYKVTWKVPGDANITFTGVLNETGSYVHDFSAPGASEHDTATLLSQGTYNFVQSGEPLAAEDPASGSGEYVFSGTFNFTLDGSSNEIFHQVLASVCPGPENVSLISDGSRTSTVSGTLSFPGSIEVEVDGVAHTTTFRPQAFVPEAGPILQELPIHGVETGTSVSPCISVSQKYSSDYPFPVFPNWDDIVAAGSPATGAMTVDLPMAQPVGFPPFFNSFTPPDDQVDDSSQATIDFELNSSITNPAFKQAVRRLVTR